MEKSVGLRQIWECYNCKVMVKGGMCNTCGCTFTEYLLSKDIKLSDLGVRLR
jgi:predicted RNA-binding protein with PUA domain